MANEFDFDVNVNGLDELKAKISSINYETERKGGRFAARRAANVVRDQVKSEAARLDDPETAENISKNVMAVFSPRTFKQTGDIKFRVGIRGGARQNKRKSSNAPGGDTFYWRFLEFGTAHIAATPFMRPAITKSAQRATDEFIKQFNKAIDRAIARSNKNR